MTTGNQTPERTIGQLVSDATNDLSSIVRGEIELAKSEVTTSVSRAGKGGAMLAVAGVLALYMLGLLLFAAAWGIEAAGLPLWAGLLIVSGVLLLIIAILALIGIKALKQVQPKPVQAINDAQTTVNTLKASLKPAAGAETPQS
ncbi:phage holin family protein [Ornithinimicrobium cryptoxanthini]|uniref:Phage holin family protein n=1 Tax=Ornithinimicrobium cryptoxanthini TaxID=2934161 RepID=A0ABY4YJ10_9MICO|nr:phage holin family protein [Ornithinimicrobium cryptoxanthini]USQ76679.1 phage holin family protein [Ornithinimicrobium cryptoxanthini]